MQASFESIENKYEAPSLSFPHVLHPRYAQQPELGVVLYARDGMHPSCLGHRHALFLDWQHFKFALVSASVQLTVLNCRWLADLVIGYLQDILGLVVKAPYERHQDKVLLCCMLAAVHAGSFSSSRCRRWSMCCHHLTTSATATEVRTVCLT